MRLELVKASNVLARLRGAPRPASRVFDRLRGGRRPYPLIGGRIELVGVELRATTSVDTDLEPTPLAGRVHATLGLLDRLRRARHTAIELSLIGREPPIPILAHHIEISSGVPELAGGRRHRDVGDLDVVPDGPQLLTQ